MDSSLEQSTKRLERIATILWITVIVEVIVLIVLL